MTEVAADEQPMAKMAANELPMAEMAADERQARRFTTHWAIPASLDSMLASETPGQRLALKYTSNTPSA